MLWVWQRLPSSIFKNGEAVELSNCVVVVIIVVVVISIVVAVVDIVTDIVDVCSCSRMRISAQKSDIVC